MGKLITKGLGAKNPTSTSVTFTPATVERVDSRKNKHGDRRHTRSSVIEHDLWLLWEILDRGLASIKQKMTKQEAKLILDVMNGTFWDHSNVSMMIGGGLAHQITEKCKLDKLDEKWSVDKDKLLTTISSLTECEIIALLDLARLFWFDVVDTDPDKYVEGFRE